MLKPLCECVSGLNSTKPEYTHRRPSLEVKSTIKMSEDNHEELDKRLSEGEPSSEEIEINSSDNSDSDDDEEEEEDELILFARNAGLNKGNKSLNQQKLQTKLEKQREEERLKLEAERKQKAKERKHKQKQSKEEKRLLFTLESLRVADSHIYEPEQEGASLTGAQKQVPPETSEELKKLYSEAYQLTQQGKGVDALPQLELVLETANTQANRVVAFSAAALLGEESLKIGRTRRAIECLEIALESARTLPHVTVDQKKYLLSRLQSAYVDVGDVERANEVLEIYGPELGLVIQSRTVVSQLSSEASARLDAALELAVKKKDLSQLQELVDTLSLTPAAFAVAQHKHPATGITPLHVSAGRNDAALVRTLLQMGASFSERDALGQTPLAWAARYGGLDALEVLLQSGARFDENISASELEKWPVAVKERVKTLIGL